MGSSGRTWEWGFSKIPLHYFNWMNNHLKLNSFNKSWWLRQDSNMRPLAWMHPLFQRCRWEKEAFLITKIQVGLDSKSKPFDILVSSNVLFVSVNNLLTEMLMSLAIGWQTDLTSYLTPNTFWLLCSSQLPSLETSLFVKYKHTLHRKLIECK